VAAKAIGGFSSHPASNSKNILVSTTVQSRLGILSEELYCWIGIQLEKGKSQIKKVTVHGFKG